MQASDRSESSELRGVRTTVLGLVINVALALTKFLAGLLGNCYALIADAVESMADIFGSFVVWRGLHVAAQPADHDHPYGHGKAEALAGLIVSMMLFGAGIAIAVQAVKEILTPHHAPAAFTLWVLLGVVIVKETLYRVMRGVAGRTKSGAVLVDAWHQRSDAITSAAAFVGISVALVGGPGYEPADDWAALLASGVILFNAYRLIWAPLHELMDKEPAGLVQEVRRIAAGQPGVRGVEKVFARKSGLRFWVDMHLEVSPDISVRDAHALAHGVKDVIRAALPQVQDVLIHVEPFREP